jgi:SAM-dependent methyltransferase
MMTPPTRNPAYLVRRLRRALRRHGPAGSAREAIHLVTRRTRRREAMRRELAFDRAHGVDTAGIVRLDELAFESESKVHGTRYEAITPEAFHDVIARVDLDDGELTFVDLGSGKGRAVLLASLYPFRRIVGVEFSPELTEVARRNVERFEHPEQQCRDIELRCEDAATYQVPAEPVLVYIYNSFEGPLMQRVLANLAASGAEHDRRLLLVTVNRAFPAGDLAAVGFRAVDGAGDVFEYAGAQRPIERAGRT